MLDASNATTHDREENETIERMMQPINLFDFSKSKQGLFGSTAMKLFSLQF